MGITGLLPFLKKSSRTANIKEFKGCTVAIDSYCWLHKGAFACADKLATGEPTDQYVYYCLKYVNSLLSFGVKPIMVFDGCRLPSKEAVEKTRRERRDLYRKKAAQLLREGKRAEARDCLQKCVDVTPQMALNLMDACRAKGVDCIVAPYEADAQLAYLNYVGIAQVVITEDSDLVLFGCEKILFKMDFAGNGVLIEKSSLNKSMDLRPDVYTFDKFRYMCILSGCDYLASLPGIGLGKANKVFKLTRQMDMNVVLKKMSTTLSMGNLNVTSEYIDAFFRADKTFLHQLCFDPMSRKLVPLTPYPPGTDQTELHFAGPAISTGKAHQIALGNIDINTGKRIADFDPDTFKPKSRTWDDNTTRSNPHLLSIWDPSYRPMKPGARAVNVTDVERPNTKSKEVIVQSSGLQKALSKFEHGGKKRSRSDLREDEGVSDVDLASSYGVSTDAMKTPLSKRAKQDSLENSQISDQRESPPSPPRSLSSSLWEDEPVEEKENISDKEAEKSPEKPRVKLEKSPRNTFAVKQPVKKDAFNLNALKVKTDVKSRFFASNKPLPRTDFFHQLAEHQPNPDAEKVVDLVKQESSTLDDIVSQHTGEEDYLRESPKKKNPFRLSFQPKITHAQKSPYGSFGFSKLNKFKSNFEKPISSSPGANKPFKPVLTPDQPRTGAFERRDSDVSLRDKESESCGEDSDVRLSGQSLLGSIDNESFNLSQSQYNSQELTASQNSNSSSRRNSSSHSQSVGDLTRDPPPLPVMPDTLLDSATSPVTTWSSTAPKSQTILSMFKKADPTTSKSGFVYPKASSQESSSYFAGSGDGPHNTVIVDDEAPSTQMSSGTPSTDKSSSSSFTPASGKSSSVGSCRRAGLSKTKPSGGETKQSSISSFLKKFAHSKWHRLSRRNYSPE